MQPSEPTIELRGISKGFGAVQALQNVDLSLYPGEVHALAGENGAGKSTLVKVLAGVHRPDEGQVLLDGRPPGFHGPGDAQHPGVPGIYPKPTLFPDPSVAETTFMGRPPRAPFARLTPDDLVQRMVGRELDTLYPKQETTPGETVLTVSRLTREGVFTDVSFEVRAGEIVALAGLVGAGRSEVARAIFGVDRYDAGGVTVSGRRLRRASPTAAMTAGVGFVPEDRRQQGLVMEMSIARNITLAS